MKNSSSTQNFTINLPKRATIDLSGFYDRIRTFCNELNNVEWSGFMLYSVEQGTLFDEMKLRFVDFILLDIGTSGFTEYRPMENEMFMDWMFENDYLNKGYKIGLVHSHNNMAVFFSGTDQETLMSNAKMFDMFLSVIVNNKMEATGKISVELEGGLAPSRLDMEGEVEAKTIGIKELDVKLFNESQVALDQIEAVRKSQPKNPESVTSIVEFVKDNPPLNIFGGRHQTIKPLHQFDADAGDTTKRPNDNLKMLRDKVFLFVFMILTGRMTVYRFHDKAEQLKRLEQVRHELPKKFTLEMFPLPLNPAVYAGHIENLLKILSLPLWHGVEEVFEVQETLRESYPSSCDKVTEKLETIMEILEEKEKENDF